jgi:hypothetical protein
MVYRIRRVGAVVIVVGVGLGIAGCASSPAAPTAASTTAPAPPPTSSDAPTSAAAPTVAQWCASYASLTSVLAQSSSDAASAATALAALERFNLLWGMADGLGIVGPEEVAANQRAVASYRAVMELVAAGSASTAPEVVKARAALTSSTDADRALLRDSAARVIGLCGAPSPTPSA